MGVKEKALEYHKKGYNCAQSVLSALSEYTNLDEKTALAISGGFGGGLRSGEICGAISGAVMAISLTCPLLDPKDKKTSKKIALLASKCVSETREEFGCVRCIELKAKKIKCEDMIGYMAEAAEKIIIENK